MQHLSTECLQKLLTSLVTVPYRSVQCNTIQSRTYFTLNYTQSLSDIK